MAGSRRVGSALRLAFLQLDAQVHVPHHDLLVGLLPYPEAPGGDHLVQGLQSRLGLAHCNQLVRPLEGILGLLEASRTPACQ